jgi:hypothetical protein
VRASLRPANLLIASCSASPLVIWGRRGGQPRVLMSLPRGRPRLQTHLSRARPGKAIALTPVPTGWRSRVTREVPYRSTRSPLAKRTSSTTAGLNRTARGRAPRTRRFTAVCQPPPGDEGRKRAGRDRPVPWAFQLVEPLSVGNYQDALLEMEPNADLDPDAQRGTDDDEWRLREVEGTSGQDGPL